MSYRTRQEFADKVDSEGGLAEFLFGYGMNPNDAPDDEVRALVKEILKAQDAFDELVGILEEIGILEEAEGDGE